MYESETDTKPAGMYCVPLEHSQETVAGEGEGGFVTAKPTILNGEFESV